MSNTTIGIDFGGTSVKCGVVRGDEMVGDEVRIPTTEFASADDLIERIVHQIKELKQNHPDVGGVGVGVPGAVDFSRGLTYNLTNVPGWSNVPLRDIIFEKTGIPTVVENDANCMAWAEHCYGAGKGYRNMVAVTLGTGVGGGLVLNGEMFRGASYAAGEIGQMSVDAFGVDGPYGNTGCLERYIGHAQISELAAKRFAEAGRSYTEEDCSPKALAEAAREGDEIARQVWHRVADYLGTALISIVFLLNPDAIVIGGGVAHAGDVLFEPLRNKIQGGLSEEFWESLAIVPATFGNTAGIIGSAALAQTET